MFFVVVMRNNVDCGVTEMNIVVFISLSILYVFTTSNSGISYIK